VKIILKKCREICKLLNLSLGTRTQKSNFNATVKIIKIIIYLYPFYTHKMLIEK
jgi:hypothetical protein